MELCRLVVHPGEIVADGTVLGVEDGQAFSLRYEVRCDSQWRVRRVGINVLSDGRDMSLSSNGAGCWFDESGSDVPTLEGCVDVDITATPFTNTLPIRRLALKPGESADIKVAYITIPELRVTPDEQRYTFLGTDSSGGRYKFEQLSSGFTAILQVDVEGVVEVYPDLFRRVWADVRWPT